MKYLCYIVTDSTNDNISNNNGNFAVLNNKPNLKDINIFDTAFQQNKYNYYINTNNESDVEIKTLNVDKEVYGVTLKYDIEYIKATRSSKSNYSGYGNPSYVFSGYVYSENKKSDQYIFICEIENYRIEDPEYECLAVGNFIQTCKSIIYLDSMEGI